MRSGGQFSSESGRLEERKDGSDLNELGQFTISGI